jgi:FkbM family methyltransferase
MPSTPSDHFGYTVNEWSSPPFSPLIDALPTDIRSVADIGANSGGFSHVLRRKLEFASFTCFEPVLDTFEYLKEALPWAKCVQKGVYYGAKESKVMWRGENIGACFLEQVNAGPDKVERKGEVVQLCELEGYGPFDLIKMDIEDAEENVIANSKAVREAKWLIVEWHPYVEPRAFFEGHLDHEVIISLEEKQFLLKKR